MNRMPVVDTSSSARDRILHGAMELFAERGFGSTSVKSIAERAGVSQGLMYRYFDSKDALLRAIFEEGLRGVWSTFGSAEDGDPFQAIEMLMHRSFAAVAERSSLWRLIYALRHQRGVLERVSPEIAAAGAEIELALERLCRRAGLPEPAIEAKALFALIDGANQHRVLDPDGYPVERVIEATVAKLRLAAAR